MSRKAFKSYWKREFSLDALSLEHHTRKDFYVSCWQQGTSPLPLLLLRGAMFASVLSIWLGSFIQFEVNRGLWFIYLTHWGLTLLLVTTFFGCAISAVAYFRKMPDDSLGLSWQEKTYWVLYNMCVPVAFLITVFYWTVLYVDPDEMMEDYDPQLLLDVSIHGLNSAVALTELATSSMPSRLLHVGHTLSFGASYMVFGLVYHLAGGVNRTGEPYVYPVVNWANPGLTLAVLLGAGVLLVLLHGLVVAAAAGRRALASRLVPDHGAPDTRDKGRFTWQQRNTAAAVL